MVGGSSPIRIAVDYRPALFGRGGIAIYTGELVRALAVACPDDHLRLYGYRFRRGDAVDPAVTPASATLRAGPLPSHAATVLGRFGLGADRLLGGVDVLHWTDYVPLRSTRAPVVATVHDVLFEELPACYTPAMRRGLRAATTRIVRTARRLLVPSTRTRDGLVAHYRVSPDRIDVVPHGVRALPEVEAARGYGERYALFVGTLEPRKNLSRLLAAHAQATREVPDLRLVLVGSRGWLDEEILARLRAAQGVAWEGAVGRRRLAALVRGATLLAYPSLGEGFGLPVLEAMSAGRPVLVGHDTTCADLAGGAGLAVDPRDVDEMAEALVRLALDPRLGASLGRVGRERARTYTWERAARATRDAYAKAAAA